MSKEMTAVGFKDFFAFEDRKQGIIANLPKTVNPDVFMNSIYALGMDEKFRNSDIKQILKCVHQAARDGLVVDNRECAIVPYKNKSGYPVMTYIPMIAGVIKRMLNSGDIAEISAQMVYENDEFDIYETHNGGQMLFRRCLRGERGQMVGAFCRINFITGGYHMEYMTIPEINTHRPAYAGSSSPWGTNYVEMALKTVIKKASRYCKMSSEMYDFLKAAALQKEEQIQDITPSAKKPKALEVDNNPPLVEEYTPPLQEEYPLFEDIHEEQPKTKAMMTILNQQDGE